MHTSTARSSGLCQLNIHSVQQVVKPNLTRAQQHSSPGLCQLNIIGVQHAGKTQAQQCTPAQFNSLVPTQHHCRAMCWWNPTSPVHTSAHSSPPLCQLNIVSAQQLVQRCLTRADQHSSSGRCQLNITAVHCAGATSLVHTSSVHQIVPTQHHQCAACWYNPTLSVHTSTFHQTSANLKSLLHNLLVQPYFTSTHQRSPPGWYQLNIVSAQKVGQPNLIRAQQHISPG